MRGPITQAIRESESAIASDVRGVLDERLKDLVTRADLLGLRNEVAGETSNLRTCMAEARTEMAEMKSEILRWMFGFWAAQMTAIVGIVFAAFKLWR